MDGTDEFDAFVKELSAWWLFLGHWPADSLATEKLLSLLVTRTRHYFDIDESGVDWELAEGEVALTLKYRPGSY